MAVSAYPWGALEPVSRAAARASTSARQAVRVACAQLSATLSDLLELPGELVVKRTHLTPVPARDTTVWLSGSGLFIGLLVEPALASFLTARLLRRAEPLADPREPLSSPLAGLLAALAVETARRSGVALSLLAAPPAVEEALTVDVAILLDGRPFGASAYIIGASSAAAEEPSLLRLGALSLSVPLVIASVAVDRQELLSLELGGALLAPPEAGLSVDGPTRGILVPPRSERGIAVEVRPDGRLVVGETTQARLTLERESPSTDRPTLTDVLLDTPIVVRVELGSVDMSAREWAQLGPGDVIEMAQRIAEPVVLRVSGREVGRGELVNVDGQIGVRIQKLYEVT